MSAPTGRRDPIRMVGLTPDQERLLEAAPELLAALRDAMTEMYNISSEADFSEDDGAMELGERLLAINDAAGAAYREIKATIAYAEGE